MAGRTPFVDQGGEDIKTQRVMKSRECLVRLGLGGGTRLFVVAEQTKWWMMGIVTHITGIVVRKGIHRWWPGL